MAPFSKATERIDRRGNNKIIAVACRSDSSISSGVDFLQNRFKQLWYDFQNRLLGKGRSATAPALIFEKFRKVLNSNNLSLEIIADMGEKLSGDFIFDRHYISSSLDRLDGSVKTSIDGLNELCNDHFRELYSVHERLADELHRLLAGREDRQGPPILMLDKIHFLDWEIIGGKAARLAEMFQDPTLLVPDGFVITTRTYHDLIDQNGLRPLLDEFGRLSSDPDADAAELERTRRQLAQKIMSASPPIGLLELIHRSLAAMADSNSSPFFLAVRSSAQEEDMNFSFAGQFRSVLHVRSQADNIFQAYLTVVASLFSMEAVTYCQQILPHGGQMSMATVCQRMVASRSSGIAFSVDTMEPDSNSMVIVGAWGLGDAVVEGQISTDTFLMSKDDSPAIIERTVVNKPRGRFQTETGGLETRKIDYSLRQEPCLSDDELQQINRKTRYLELLFKGPQDIEWSFDESGTLYILQTRPLIIASEALPARALPDTLADYETLMTGRGRVARQGIGAGPVKIIHGPKDLADFPDGAVLVSRLDSSHFVKVMKRAAAIVTEVGTPVSHMSTLCREMRVPCLVNVGNILSRLNNGEEITVDAEDRVIYRGRVRELLAYNSTSSVQINESQEFRLLRRLLKKVATLNLVDPLLQNFTIDGCRTYHDILRFVHETAVMELVNLGRDEGMLLHGHLARHMDLPVPAGILVVDIGGGLRKDAPDEGVKFTDVTSIPFHAILQGMLFPDVWNMETMRVGMRDLMSSMLSVPRDTLDGRYSGHNIAIISREYVNLCFRLGYHFNIIDAHCSSNERDNHIYFRFLGGASDITKRTRRAVMIATILEAFDFNVRTKGDMVVARCGNMVPEEMERVLDILGRLVGFTRQLDVHLDSDRIVDQYVEAFLYGNYSLVTSQGGRFN